MKEEQEDAASDGGDGSSRVQTLQKTAGAESTRQASRQTQSKVKEDVAIGWSELVRREQGKGPGPSAILAGTMGGAV